MKDRYSILSLLVVFGFAILLSACTEEDPAPVNPMEEPDEMNDGSNGDDDSGMGSSSDTTIIDDPGSAPLFTLQSFSGMNVSRTDFLGKPLVIYFFGSSCPNCIASGPRVESDVHFAFSNKIYMVGIDTWDGNEAAVMNFRNSTGVTFDLLLNGSQVEDEYQTTYDRFVVLDAEGNVAYKGTSSAGSTIENVEEVLNGLLQ